MIYDVVIAGAGPAGVATAVALVRQDPSLRGRLLVLDRARFPRSKPCGGGLTGHAERGLAKLGLALTVPSVAAAQAEVRFGEWRRQVTLKRPVRIVRREEFDASLVAQARDLGVTVREQAPLADFRITPPTVELTVGQGEALQARVLVGADGVGSKVRKHLWGATPKETPIRLFRLELPARGRWGTEAMLYDFSAMREGLRGYLWVFPVPGERLNVGLMHDPGTVRSGAELEALLRRHLDRLGLPVSGAARGWPAFGYHPRVPLGGSHLLTVGDAAGIDALTGEGIAVGLEQAPLAAAAILRAFDRGDFCFTGYTARVRRAEVGRELGIDRWLARLLYRGDWRRWLALVLCDPRMLELYAARVAGTLVLADHKRELVWALLRHLPAGRARQRALQTATEALQAA